jgi:glutamine synthetase
MQWSILKQTESVLVGTAHRGMNALGVHAIAGILKHAGAITAIALSNGSHSDRFPWLQCCSSEIAKAICRISIASHNPRTRTIEYRGTPAGSNPYLVNSAILMAMIDGIQNKMSPGSALDPNTHPDSVYDWDQWDNGYHPWQVSLDNDRDFLIRGDVFSDQLIDLLCSRFH